MGRITEKYSSACGRITACVLFLLLLLPYPALCEDINNEVFIDADIVSYMENTGVASADGNVKIRNGNLRFFAPHAEYNGTTQTIEAFSDTRGNVTLISGTNKLNGEYLNYNLATRRGVLTKPSGKMEAFYLNAHDVKVMPIEDAVKSGVIKTQSLKAKQQSNDDLIAEWLDVTTTTCDFKNPHYRLDSKKIIVIPNKKVIIKNPKVYIGKTCIFTYPFDYIVGLGHKEQSVLPFLGYDSDKGAGIGIKGPVDIGTMGELYIMGTYWTNDIWEASINFRKEILDGLYIFAESDRLYNEDDKEIMWRPKWGLEYNKDGWSASFYESQRELVETEMQPGDDKRFNVWRSPEFNVYSPWYGDAARGAKFRVFGIYGRYQDNAETLNPLVNRLVLGAEIKGAPDMGESVIQPYYGARYIHHDYDSGEDTQKVTDGWIGVTYSIGAVNFDSYYFRRWVDGTSPFLWDRYEEREDFYQTVSFPLPFGGASWEKWTFSVRAGYDNISNEIAEMVYRINYNKHCMTWQLWARDSRRNDQLTMGLTFYINAYPENVLGLGSDNSDVLTK